jgi:hypothetical protein
MISDRPDSTRRNTVEFLSDRETYVQSSSCKEFFLPSRKMRFFREIVSCGTPVRIEARLSATWSGRVARA